MPTNLLHTPSHFSRTGLFVLKFSGHVWLVYILTWNYKKIKIKINFILAMSKPNSKVCSIIFFWNAWKIDSCFCSVEKLCRFKTGVKISSPKKKKSNFAKVFYEENRVGVTLGFEHISDSCATVLQCTAVVRKHYVVPRPAQLTKTTKSARKRAPIDCARAKPTAIHWLIYLVLKKVSHLWNYKKKSCLIWLILLFFVLSYVFQKNNVSKKVGKIW